MLIAARFLVPFRPYLFSKPEPPLLHLTKTALEEDEVFMILIFIYSEVKRQDKTVSLRYDSLGSNEIINCFQNSSSSNGGVGW